MSKKKSEKSSDNKNFWWNLINTLIAALGFLLALFVFFQHGYEIDNLKKLNKQHLDPNLMLMVSKNPDEANTIMI